MKFLISAKRLADHNFVRFSLNWTYSRIILTNLFFIINTFLILLIVHTGGKLFDDYIILCCTSRKLTNIRSQEFRTTLFEKYKESFMLSMLQIVYSRSQVWKTSSSKFFTKFKMVWVIFVGNKESPSKNVITFSCHFYICY